MRFIIMLLLFFTCSAQAEDFLVQRLVIPIGDNYYDSKEMSKYDSDGIGYNDEGQLIFCLDGRLNENQMCDDDSVSSKPFTVKSYLERHRKLNHIKNELVAQGYSFVWDGESGTYVSGLIVGYIIEGKTK